MSIRRTVAAGVVLIAALGCCLSSTLTATPIQFFFFEAEASFGDSANSLKNRTDESATMLVRGPEQNDSFYDPIEKEVEGWKVAVDPKLLAEEDLSKSVFTALANHLQRIKYIVPSERVEQLQQLRIWIELENPSLKSMQYHPSRGWLLANQHDPRLVQHVHIPHARDLLKRSTWAKHPYVVLHELAHAYHDQVLSFDAPLIVNTFNEAKDEGIYENVLLFTGKKVRHYGLSNHKEYFAESTEAYFGVNDFFPFVRAELKEHDPRMYEVMKTVWGPID